MGKQAASAADRGVFSLRVDTGTEWRAASATSCHPVDGLRFCRGACCVSDKLADLFPKARRFKRGDLSAIHPQQGRLFRTINTAPMGRASISSRPPNIAQSPEICATFHNSKRQVGSALGVALLTTVGSRLTGARRPV